MRVFGGRYYLLYEAMNWFQCLGEDADEHLAHAVEVAKRHWKYVRVVKEARRCRAFVYVFEAID